MTQEELDKIARRYAQDELKDNHGQVEDIVAAAFLNGIDYAEHHPHWISVEDELPEKGDIVIVMQDAYGNIHFTACKFLAAKQLGNVTDFHVRSDAYLGISKNAEVTIGAVTHWMRIEPPAVLSRLERTGKNWKGGEQ